MQDLGFYFDLGWHHILAWAALDHWLFILVLTAIYLVKDWKKLIVLITAFTIGHSVTLALSVFDLIRVQEAVVEFLIPCTIVITAMYNLLEKEYLSKSIRTNYFLTLFFGLIHGLGFANALRFMLASNQNIGWSLLGFNIGLEIGQIVLVTAILLISYLLVDKIGIKRKWWILALSLPSLIIAIKLAWERFPY